MTRERERPRVAMLTSVHPPLDVRIFHREARSLVEAGFDVLVVAPGAPAEPRDGVGFRSLPAWGGRLARPLRWPALLWHALRSGARVFHIHDPELLPWALLLRWTTRRPVIYDSHEFLQESLLDRHWLPAPVRRPLAGLAGRVEKLIASRLSAVIVVTEEMGERFTSVQPRTILIRNLAAPPDIPYPPPERLPVVVYAGLMNVNRGLGILWETAMRVRERCPAAEFHILGPVEWFGVEASHRRRSKAEWERAGVRFLGTVPPAEVASVLSRAAVGWLPLDPQVRNARLSWPTKLAEYMIVGLPVVASDIPVAVRVVSTEQCGRVVPGLDAEAHAEAIAGLLLNEEEARAAGARGREAALAKYTWPQEAKKLHSLYGELLAAQG